MFLVKTTSVDHRKLPLLKFCVFRAISMPLFCTLPRLKSTYPTPLAVGIVLVCNWSVVLDLYRSMEPEILFLNMPNSIPTLAVVVFSHERSGFLKVEGAAPIAAVPLPQL